jgi:hypothetical protein
MTPFSEQILKKERFFQNLFSFGPVFGTFCEIGTPREARDFCRGREN